MPRKLQSEIAQSKPFGSIEEVAFLNLAKSAGVLQQKLEELLKPYGISHTQYNVLRILRGAGSGGLSCREVGARMISHDPDITRLLDRMEASALVTRGRATADRRVVVTRITLPGLKLIEQLDQPLATHLKDALRHVGKTKLALLIGLLELIRK